MKITLDSRIGNCGLVINAVIDVVDGFTKLVNAAVKQIVFHDSASEAFKEKSEYKRDSVYSDGLAAHVVGIITAKLTALGFTDIVITTKAYVKPTDEAKFTKAMSAIGFDAKAIAEMWAKHPENKPKTEAKVDAPVEAKTEKSETVSLS